MAEQARQTLHEEQLRMEQGMRSNFVLLVLMFSILIAEVLLLLWHEFYKIERLASISDGWLWTMLIGNAVVVVAAIMSVVNIVSYNKKLHKIEQSIQRANS